MSSKSSNKFNGPCTTVCQDAAADHNGHRASYEALYKAIANYVAKQYQCQRQCGFAELFDIFGEGVANPYNTKQFGKRLQTMMARGLIAKVGTHYDRAYVPAGAMKYGVQRYAADSMAHDPRLLATVPPTAYNPMRAPVWQPPRLTPVRSGSEDFLRVPSQGNRC